jgi:RNA polymerase sigma factor (sigma-70 family)
MRQIKNQDLAQLLLQLRFTPISKRRKQLDAAEKLFDIIDPVKEYPFDFVQFRITGLHPRPVPSTSSRLGEAPSRSRTGQALSGAEGSLPAQRLIKGDQLLEDLRIFISKLSGRLACPAAEQKEKIYTIEELASAFDVSTKTVRRWQKKRDLIARKYIFSDGQRRFGFLQSTVDKFAQQNPSLIDKAKSFKRLTKKHKQQIIRQARTLASKTNLSRYQIIEQIASKIGRAHETIRYTLLEYEKTHPERAIFNKSASTIKPADAAELYKFYKQGITIAELIAIFNRSRSSIYRIINQQRARALLARKIEYIASDEFLQEGAREKILATGNWKLETDNWFNSNSNHQLPITDYETPPGDHLLPEYIQTLKDAPVLNRERELELFRRYNFLKFLACKMRAEIKLSKVSGVQLTKIENYLAEAEAVKKIIIEANLRLVVSIASKHITSGASFLELVSKGNFALINAVEEFDYTKGFRFGKRAALNIAKEYAKESGKTTELSRKRAVSLAALQRELGSAAADIGAIERARQSLTETIKNELDEREQYVILNHFGLVGSPVKKQKKTLKKIGEDLCLTKERVRQIELLALQKLRQSLSSEEFDLLTGA